MGLVYFHSFAIHSFYENQTCRYTYRYTQTWIIQIQKATPFAMIFPIRDTSPQRLAALPMLAPSVVGRQRGFKLKKKTSRGIAARNRR